MHIAFCSPAWPAAGVTNGIVTYVSHVKNALEKKGHRVTVFTGAAMYPATGEKIELNVPKPNFVRRLANRLFSFSNWHVLEGKRLAAAISQHCTDLDLVEMEESFGLVDALQSMLPIPVVVRLHGPNFLVQINQLFGKALLKSNARTKNEGAAIKSARYITAPSDQILRYCLNYYGANPKITASFFNPAPEQPGKLWSYKKANLYEILHVGRFDRLKGADLMIQSFCLIATKYRSARLIIVGPETGLQVEKGEMLTFVDYCQRYVPDELRDRVIFLGSQREEEITQLRLRSHVSVVPSRFETMSYCALETLSMGAPLICADGFADDALVIDNETGWYFQNGSVKSLAAAIVKAFECGDNITHIANEGRKRCRTHFDPDVIAPKMIGFYETVLRDFHSG